MLSSLSAMPVKAETAGQPQIAQGIQIGVQDSGDYLIWSRTDRPAKMLVEYAFNPDFHHSIRLPGIIAARQADFTARQLLTNLPAGQDVYLKVRFQGLSANQPLGDIVSGQFHTLGENDNIRFIWGADTCGQGWGINESFGGFKIYQAMRLAQPQFFIQNGDSIYADVPIPASQPAENGQIWTNIVTPEVGKVAETLQEFRGRYQYNLLDKNLRSFNAAVPQIWQWDDHEVLNNWSAAKDLSADKRYTEKNLAVLVKRAGQAFREYAPIYWQDGSRSKPIYRKISFGKLLEVFVLDMRSFRGGNSDNLQTTESPATAFLGKQQIAWLEAQLKQSTAVWKVISADMPIGLNVSDGQDSQGRPRWEAIANGQDGPPAGRELEIQGLLQFIKHQHIQNIVWLTGDVHYAAAHYYDPEKAKFQDFSPFWEFVAGPLHAGTFGPVSADGTFGPQVMFSKTPPAGQANLSPLAGLQFFGEVNIDQQSREITVSLKDIHGGKLFSQLLKPVLPD